MWSTKGVLASVLSILRNVGVLYYVRKVPLIYTWGMIYQPCQRHSLAWVFVSYFASTSASLRFNRNILYLPSPSSVLPALRCNLPPTPLPFYPFLLTATPQPPLLLANQCACFKFASLA
ncbi:hypothetical protein Pmani_024521 [Petrolisthes manimaculis]|uniref:Uncharacterized protein n=1 Tax=Petrolisthes manimaculis TaxID=1843537 RepID=A0AAE1P9K4_9EUCA|nr:hypothetical protein Pmani_024521 [Petrolisthes manimaculis]